MIIQVKDSYLSEYLCDTIDDINKLPTNQNKNDPHDFCNIGSTAYVIENQKNYILTSNGSWQPYFPNTSVGGGETGNGTTSTTTLVFTDDSQGNVSVKLL